MDVFYYQKKKSNSVIEIIELLGTGMCKRSPLVAANYLNLPLHCCHIRHTPVIVKGIIHDYPKNGMKVPFLLNQYCSGKFVPYT